MTHWYKINQDMENCTEIKFSRRFFASDTNETGGPVLHVFVDANKVAYGACAYLVKGNESAFVMAQNRVAPLKQLTIPQLELMAVLIGGRLASHILSSLHVEKCVLRSESNSTTLAFIKETA
jgi:hypothetical protein